jgi:eukaryotic-like serine/threonine-protein kinase
MAFDLPARFTNVIRWASSGSDSDGSDRFLQSRVALYTRFMAILFGLLYVAGAVLTALFAPRYWVRVHVHPAKIANLVLALEMLVFAGVLARHRLPGFWVRASDLSATLSIALGVCLGMATAPPGYQLELAGLLIIVLTLVIRSAIVPSTAGFTAMVGFVSAPPVVLGSYLQAIAGPPLGFLTPGFLSLAVAAWCVATSITTAMVSRVIYGLVAQVEKAMQLGRYTLREKIGEGGMGMVYRAEHAMLRRATAIKLLLPERVSAAALARFEREVQLTSQLSHPNTIAIYDYGRTPEGTFYYAMEYLDGRSLERLVAEEGPQAPGRVVHILRQVVGSLSEAHQIGLIHRDIKPGNLLLGARGGLPDFVKVIDFGLVKQIEHAEDVAVTRNDALTGTPLFMAPESITNPTSIDGKVDTYALGAVAYFLLTGTPPFQGASMVEICGHHMLTPPTPPSERLGSRVPPKLEALVLRCLAKQPDARPDDNELARQLRECKVESPRA